MVEEIFGYALLFLMLVLLGAFVVWIVKGMFFDE